jgi:peptide-methionine (S)-S-oxide reductase
LPEKVGGCVAVECDHIVEWIDVEVSPLGKTGWRVCRLEVAIMHFGKKKTKMPEPDEALSGRDEAIAPPESHAVLGTEMSPPFPDDTELAMFGMGCFWGAEQLFWEADGVYSTQVGYAGGYTPNPTYEEVCTSETGHAEVVRVVFRPEVLSYGELVAMFWENHDPTQGMKQGHDVGTQYRSALYWYNDRQKATARETKEAYQTELRESGYADITTEFGEAPEFYYAEQYHQQYLSKNPGGYCGIGGTGVECPTGLETDAAE